MNHDIDHSNFFERSEHVVSRTIRGEMLLVPIKSSSDGLDAFYALNRTASDIWTWVCQGYDTDQIGEKLQHKYTVDKMTALSDLKRILQELVAIGALRVRKKEP